MKEKRQVVRFSQEKLPENLKSFWIELPAAGQLAVSTIDASLVGIGVVGSEGIAKHLTNTAPVTLHSSDDSFKLKGEIKYLKVDNDNFHLGIQFKGAKSLETFHSLLHKSGLI